MPSCAEPYEYVGFRNEEMGRVQRYITQTIPGYGWRGVPVVGSMSVIAWLLQLPVMDAARV